MASTNNDNLKAFLLENAIPAEEVTYVASRRFVGADRKPIAWKLRILTSEESDKLLNQSKHKEFVPGTRDIKIVTDNEAFLNSQVRIYLQQVSYLPRLPGWARASSIPSRPWLMCSLLSLISWAVFFRIR